MVFALIALAQNLKVIETNIIKKNCLNLKCKGFNAVCLNVRHILSKFDELKNIITINNRYLDLFGLVETLLKPDINNEQCKVPGYKIFRKDRQSKDGGGLLVYVKDSIAVKNRSDLSIITLETLWLEVEFPKSKPFFICTVYRPPNSPQSWIDIRRCESNQAFNCSNLISTKQHESELEEKIIKEIQAGRIAGPFKNKPFSNLRLSPIGLVAKKPPPGSKTHGWRMIQHLSYPLGSSINSFIDPQLATVQYTSFDKVLGTISKLGKGAELGRMDIVSAFRLLILHPDEFVLFGFRFQDNFYFQKALPMGCPTASALFEKFACFLEWLVRFQSCKESIEHYLDDFLLAGKARLGEGLHLMNNFRTICSDIGVPLAEEKKL
ncbi:unnamed protein product [Mytilus coruscus]|uniref:Reverse transcriptase domain-containing protein n=1 Tax=Mytilus coruscus TaxID=42192 RepID=A0A6J8CDW6_MYTCO|nr:unnamed protein product [Mytilus coruscus]